MAICVAASEDKCFKLAKDKCLASFRDARIAVNDERVVAKKAASKLIFCSMMMAKGTGFWSLLGTDRRGEWVLADCGVEVTNYRGSVVLDSDV